jgi:hypothetical protein
MALVVQRWQRHGQHRLYVKDADTRAQLGYYDVRTGRLSVRDDARSYEVVGALRPYLSGSVPFGLAHLMPEYPAPPESLLASTEAYETFSANAARPRPRRGRRGFTRTAWPRGSKGERVVGRRLARLAHDGWDVLRAETLHSPTEAGFLVIGPPGAFTVNTLHHPRARIRVGSQVVWVDNAIREYLRNARVEAASVARRLGELLGGGVAVPVRPVLAFVGAVSLETHDGHPDVLVVAGDALDRELRDCRGELSLPERDRIVAAAYRCGLWTS